MTRPPSDRQHARKGTPPPFSGGKSTAPTRKPNQERSAHEHSPLHDNRHKNKPHPGPLSQSEREQFVVDLPLETTANPSEKVPYPSPPLEKAAPTIRPSQERSGWEHNLTQTNHHQQRPELGSTLQNERRQNLADPSLPAKTDTIKATPCPPPLLEIAALIHQPNPKRSAREHSPLHDYCHKNKPPPQPLLQNEHGQAFVDS